MSILKHTTKSIVVDIFDQGENDRVYKLFTRDFGMIFAHAKSIRKLESKLRPHLAIGRLQTVTVVKGREVFRITGASDSGEKNIFLHDVTQILNRFIRGEGTHKKLFDKIIDLSQKIKIFDNTKLRTLVYFIILVDLGYADAKMIGVKDISEYINLNVDDLYTHLLLNYEQIKKFATGNHQKANK